MYSEFLVPVTWGIFWGATAAIIKFDDHRAKALAAKQGTVDFAERGIRSYLLLALVIGGPVLIVYFWATRKSYKGGLLGLGALAAVFLVTMVLGTGFAVVARGLDFAAG